MNVNVSIWVVFLWGLLGGVSCAQEKERVSNLTYTETVLHEEKCVGEDCAEVEFKFPVFEGKRKLVDRLNIHVREQMLMYLSWEGKKEASDTLEIAIENFLGQFEDYRKEYPDLGQSWYVKGEATVKSHHKKLLSLLFSNHSYLGGAHPNSFLLYLNFDLTDGRLLQKEEMILDEDRLLEKAEHAFRDFHNVDSDVSLEDDGRFFLKDGAFFLPAAIGYEGQELVLIYNSYEIGPYAMGQTELRFPLEELEGLVLLPE